MKELLSPVLDEIRAAASRIAAAEEAQLRVWRGQKTDCQPLLLHCALTEDEVAAFPRYTNREIYLDATCNLVSQLPAMLSAIRGGAQAVPSARANMGCGIYASLFGMTQTLFDDKMPWLTDHLPKEAVEEMTASDSEPGTAFQTGLDHMALLSRTLKDTGARVFPMDLQGPVDLAHLVIGDAFFYELYDDPDFVGHLLDLCVEACLRGSELCLAAIPGANRSVPHYNELVLPRERGGIKTSEDTTTLLSASHIADFATPALSKVFRGSGGGYVHYCGRNDHLLAAVLAEQNVLGINFGNPDRHDMEDVLRQCAAAGKVYYGAIPRNPDEQWEPYFTRLLRASRRDGRSHLLLRTSCMATERLQVLDAWERANIAADRSEA